MGHSVADKDEQFNGFHGAESTKRVARRAVTFQKPRSHYCNISELEQQELDCDGHQYECIRASRARVGRFGAGMGDPFRTLPHLVKGDTSVLAHHWNKNFIVNTTPPGRREQWFPLAFTDPALFHAILLVSASHMAGLKRSRPSFAYYQHRGEVIRIVSDRISSGHLASKDGTIGAISMLILTDSMSGHPERVNAHMAGMQQLISQRGGISTLNPQIQSLVGWIDVLASISLLKRPSYLHPRYSKPDFNSYYGPPSSSTICYAMAFNARIMNFTGLKKHGELAARILWGLRNISLIQEILEKTKRENDDIIIFTDRIELLEREVQTLLHDALEHMEHAPALGKLHPTIISVIFACATLIYTSFNFREMIPSPLTCGLAERLEQALKDLPGCDLNILLGTFPDLMLWVLFIGGDPRSGRPKRWYARTAARILKVKKIEEEDGIKAMMTAFMWPEGRANYDATMDEDIGMPNARRSRDCEKCFATSELLVVMTLPIAILARSLSRQLSGSNFDAFSVAIISSLADGSLVAKFASSPFTSKGANMLPKESFGGSAEKDGTNAGTRV